MQHANHIILRAKGDLSWKTIRDPWGGERPFTNEPLWSSRPLPAKRSHITNAHELSGSANLLPRLRFIWRSTDDATRRVGEGQAGALCNSVYNVNVLCAIPSSPCLLCWHLHVYSSPSDRCFVFFLRSSELLCSAANFPTVGLKKGLFYLILKYATTEKKTWLTFQPSNPSAQPPAHCLPWRMKRW